MTEFVRRPGFRLKTKPQIVGEVCQALEQQGKLTPRELVEASRDKKAPLHNEFEWRNSIAAQKYREVQAGYIIRSVAIKITSLPQETTTLNLQIKNSNDTVRFYHAVTLDKKGYENLESISSDEEKTNKLLQLCLKDIQSFKEKYEVLRSVLPKFFDVIDETLDENNE